MNKRLQTEMLKYIKKLNDEKGSSYNLAWQDFNDHFRKDNIFSGPETVNNIKYLEDEKKIEIPPGGSVRITARGCQEFDPWYKKVWNFFTDDFAKILSIVATIITILIAVFK